MATDYDPMTAPIPEGDMNGPHGPLPEEKAKPRPAVGEPTTAAERACAYIIQRIQTDPDFRYYVDPFTETFHLLCVAAAEWTGLDLAEVKRRAALDLLPPHRKRMPEVLELRQRLEMLKNG